MLPGVQYFSDSVMKGICNEHSGTNRSSRDYTSWGSNRTQDPSPPQDLSPYLAFYDADWYREFSSSEHLASYPLETDRGREDPGRFHREPKLNRPSTITHGPKFGRAKYDRY